MRNIPAPPLYEKFLKDRGLSSKNTGVLYQQKYLFDEFTKWQQTPTWVTDENGRTLQVTQEQLLAKGATKGYKQATPEQIQKAQKQAEFNSYMEKYLPGFATGKMSANSQRAWSDGISAGMQALGTKIEDMTPEQMDAFAKGMTSSSMRDYVQGQRRSYVKKDIEWMQNQFKNIAGMATFFLGLSPNMTTAGLTAQAGLAGAIAPELSKAFQIAPLMGGVAEKLNPPTNQTTPTTPTPTTTSATTPFAGIPIVGDIFSGIKDLLNTPLSAGLTLGQAGEAIAQTAEQKRIQQEAEALSERQRAIQRQQFATSRQELSQQYGEAGRQTAESIAERGFFGTPYYLQEQAKLKQAYETAQAKINQSEQIAEKQEDLRELQATPTFWQSYVRQQPVEQEMDWLKKIYSYISPTTPQTTTAQ